VHKHFVGFLSLSLAACLLSPDAAAQNSDTSDGVSTRQLWDENLQKRRPATARTRPATPRKATPQAEKLGDAFVGFTLWQLRPSRSGDEEGTRLLVHEEETGERQQLTAERVNSDTPLADGSKVRVSIEPARAGYLYVVDREQYSDGSFSDPWLIFPTTRIRNGNNSVGPGTVIEVPDPDNKMPYFRLTRNKARRTSSAGQSAPEQVSEVLTVLISPQPITGVKIGRTPQKLSTEQFAQWERQWATQTKTLEATGSGASYTQAEKQAGKGDGVLTGDDPLPQTMIQSEAKPGDPLLVTVPIRISDKRPQN
jgi:hypothetical protein